MNDDTIKLLKECSSGICMARDAIDEILEDVRDDDLKGILQNSIKEHDALKEDTENYLKAFHEEPEKPSAIAKGMAHLKSNVKLAADNSDATVADLITDGCNMGIKSLHRYLNQYQAADEETKDIAKKLIKQEEELSIHMRSFL